MRMVYWAVTAVAALVCSLFAVSNRDIVALGLWPLPFAIDAPLYLLVFMVLLIGFVVGALAVWIGGRQRRRALRRCRRRVDALERELAATQSHLEPPAGPASAALPAHR